MIRFAVKAAIAGTAVYFLKQEGVWKDSNESLKAYDKLNKTLEPHVNDICKKIPIELPEIPSSQRSTQTFKLYWNKGVTSTFQFLSELPSLINSWAHQGLDALMETPEMKKLLDASDKATTKT